MNESLNKSIVYPLLFSDKLVWQPNLVLLWQRKRIEENGGPFGLIFFYMFG